MITTTAALDLQTLAKLMVDQRNTAHALFRDSATMQQLQDSGTARPLQHLCPLHHLCQEGQPMLLQALI